MNYLMFKKHITEIMNSYISELLNVLESIRLRCVCLRLRV